MRLYVNVDHVATVRQARRADEPDPVEAARLAEEGGADGITIHLREDRRHIQDHDVHSLKRTTTGVLNLELATAPDIIDLACDLLPDQVTFVPEKREEITTEGGLDVGGDTEPLRSAIQRLRDLEVRISLFVDPDPAVVKTCLDLGAHAVEYHTGDYANHPDDPKPLERLREAAAAGKAIGLGIHAGHGLTYRNVQPVASIQDIEELNIGHSIVSRGLFVGMEEAVSEMRQLIDAAR